MRTRRRIHRQRGRLRPHHARRALLGGFAVLCVLAIAAPARADTVTDWDQIAAAALQSPGTATPPGAGQGAPSIAHLAMVHAAVYDAVNTIDGGHKPYASSPAAEPFYSQDAAVAAAAHHVLVNGGLGISAARKSTINSAYGRRSPRSPGPAKDGGIATGEAAAVALLAARAGDGRLRGRRPVQPPVNRGKSALASVPEAGVGSPGDTRHGPTRSWTC